MCVCVPADAVLRLGEDYVAVKPAIYWFQPAGSLLTGGAIVGKTYSLHCCCVLVLKPHLDLMSEKVHVEVKQRLRQQRGCFLWRPAAF